MTPPQIKERIQAILDGCEGVTPGPWATGTWRDMIYSTFGGVWQRICRVKRNDEEATDDNQDVIDAAHIARLDPDTVKTLCTLALRGLEATANEPGGAEPIGIIVPYDGGPEMEVLWYEGHDVQVGDEVYAHPAPQDGVPAPVAVTFGSERTDF